MEVTQQLILETDLKQLRLPVFLKDYGQCARQAKEESAPYEAFLQDLARREIEKRQANQLQRRLKSARFTQMKTLESSDFNLWPHSLRFILFLLMFVGACMGSTGGGIRRNRPV